MSVGLLILNRHGKTGGSGRVGSVQVGSIRLLVKRVARQKRVILSELKRVRVNRVACWVGLVDPYFSHEFFFNK